MAPPAGPFGRPNLIPGEPPVEHIANALAALAFYREAETERGTWEEMGELPPTLQQILVSVEARLSRALAQLRGANA